MNLLLELTHSWYRFQINLVSSHSERTLGAPNRYAPPGTPTVEALRDAIAAQLTLQQLAMIGNAMQPSAPYTA